MFFITACIILGGLAQEVEFSYNGERGPENWHLLDPSFATCGSGQQQSPVNFQNMSILSTNLPFINWAPKVAGAIENTGHDIIVRLDEASSQASTMQANNGLTYNLIQAHLHFKSEHRRQGEQFEFEMHFVHQAPTEEFAVVGVWVSVANQTSPFISSFFANGIPTTETPIANISDISTAELNSTFSSVWNYPGSFTTPPCTEGVNWFMIDQKAEVTQELYDSLVAATNENARPAQNRPDIGAPTTPVVTSTTSYYYPTGTTTVDVMPPVGTSTTIGYPSYTTTADVMPPVGTPTALPPVETTEYPYDTTYGPEVTLQPILSSALSSFKISLSMIVSAGMMAFL